MLFAGFLKTRIKLGNWFKWKKSTKFISLTNIRSDIRIFKEKEGLNVLIS